MRLCTCVRATSASWMPPTTSGCRLGPACATAAGCATPSPAGAPPRRLHAAALRRLQRHPMSVTGRQSRHDSYAMPACIALLSEHFALHAPPTESHTHPTTNSHCKQGGGCAVRGCQRRQRPHAGAADAGLHRRRISAQGKKPFGDGEGCAALALDSLQHAGAAPVLRPAAPVCGNESQTELPLPLLQDTCFTVEVPPPIAGHPEFVIHRR